MARYPGAQWRPLPAGAVSTAQMTAHDIICIHTMVGSLAGTDTYFRTGAVNSHFGTGGDGTVYQWVDTTTQSWANLNGNYHVISIENADIGPEFPSWDTSNGAAVPAFTAAQIEAIANIVAWACKTYNIPCVEIPDALPGRRGIGYHRQGIPGYMVAGAELWSNSAGKVCPGDRRIAQIPQIIKRANDIINGVPIEEDQLPYTPEQLAGYASDGVANRGIGPFGYAWQTWNAAAVQADAAVRAIAALNTKIDQLAAAVAKLTPPA